MTAPFLLRAAAMFAAAASVALAAIPPTPPTSSSTNPLAPPANGMRPLEPGRGWFALANATLHAKPGETLEHAMVIVQDGRILSVLSRADGQPPLSAPAGAEARDCTGLHIYPGFIDAFVEIDVPSPDPKAPGSHWNSRVTPQRSALDRGSAGIDDKTARTLRSMGFTAAAISPDGGVFAGSSAVVSLAEPATDPARPRARVYRDKAYSSVAFETSDRRRRAPIDPSRGDDLVWTRYPDSQMGAIALIRQTLNDALWQNAARSSKAFTTPNNALDALAPSTPSDDPAAQLGPRLLFDATDELEVLRAGAIAREFNWSSAVIGSGLEFRRLDAIKKDNLPIVLPLAYPPRPNVSTLGRAESVELTELANWEQAPTNPRRLDAAGIKVSLTTSKIPVKQGGRGAFDDRLRSAIMHGLGADRALAMLTTNPAELLGVSDQLGTIEPGKTANLVIADAPLFADVPDAPKEAKKVKILEVWIDGQRHAISPKPDVPLAGTWTVILSPAPTNAGVITLTISERDEITITETTPPKAPDTKPVVVTAKARQVRLTDNRVSFVFDHDKFGEPGVLVSSGVVEREGTAPDAKDAKLVMHGEGTLPSGNHFKFTATRTGDAPAPTPVNPAAATAATPPGAPAAEAPKKPATPEHDDLAAIPEKLGLPFGPYALPTYPEPATTILTNATVWTSGPQGVIDNGAVAISAGKIVYVGPAAGVPTLSSATTIDARGKFITPGIIDPHSHTGISKGVNESGQAVTAEVRIQDVTDPDSLSWYRQLAGGVTAVSNLHGSANPIGGQNCVNKIRWGCTAPNDMHLAGAIPGIKFALGENVKQSNWGNQFQSRYPQTRMGVETLIRDRFTAAREYAAQWDSWQKSNERTPDGFTDARVYRRSGASLPPRRDLELEALAEIIENRRLVHCHSYRQDEILMLCRVAGDFGFTIGTFQHDLEGYKVAEAMREHALGGSMFSDWWAYKVEVQDAIPAAGPIASEQGVLMSYNSDSDELARRLNVEAGKAVKYSGGGGPKTKIAPPDAFKFVTINPAKQLKIDNVTGSIEVGKDADLALWSGIPTSSTSRCEATYVDGRPLFSLARDTEHRTTIASERARLIQKILAQENRGGGGGGPGPSKDSDDAKKPDAPTETDTLSSEDLAIARAAGRALIPAAIDNARAVRRLHYLGMLQRGLDPRYHRAGDCGCDASLFGN